MFCSGDGVNCIVRTYYSTDVILLCLFYYVYSIIFILLYLFYYVYFIIFILFISKNGNCNLDNTAFKMMRLLTAEKN